jgi:hypothetical protein
MYGAVSAPKNLFCENFIAVMVQSSGDNGAVDGGFYTQ